MTSPSTSSGTPRSDSSPFSRRIGLQMSASARFRIRTGLRVAAMRPAKPRPIGILIPRSTSSSSPFAARAMSVRVVVLEQEDRRGVDPEDPDDAREQLVEQAFERQIGKRRVGDALEITQPIGGDARLHGGDSAAPYGASRSRTASLNPTSAARR